MQSLGPLTKEDLTSLSAGTGLEPETLGRCPTPDFTIASLVLGFKSKVWIFYSLYLH